MLELQNVSKSYRRGTPQEVKAATSIALTVRGGEFVAVQGPSGSGKTTLLLMAGGLLAPDTGQVLVNGQNPYALPANARARFRAEHIGFVFQQFHLVPYLSVLDNVLAPVLAVPSNGHSARDRASDLLTRFGLAHRLQHVPAELSTGERQRTALARALLNRPNILLADEPTGNLDRDNAETVLQYMAKFVKEGGAVLLVTHEEHALRHAHRVHRLGISSPPAGLR
jgi:putative ABC transport system ATP-binding protein